jgi:hypothetical protein
MDNTILKKKLNTFKAGESGQLRTVSNEVVMEVLRAWENWPGKASDLYRELGLSKMQLVTMIQKAKRLVKSGVVQESEFKEVAVAGAEAVGLRPCVGIELVWGEGKVIRFPSVEPLLDFLKKAA